MPIDKSPVLIGTHPTKNLPVYRTFLDFTASRKLETITVNYSEHLLSNGVAVEVREPKHYIVKNLIIGDEANGVEIEEEFGGFNNWLTIDVGQFPNGTTLEQIIVGAINQT